MISAEAGDTPRSAGRTPRHAAAPVRNKVRGLIAALALIAVLAPLQRWWAAQVLLVPLLLTAPGMILMRALRIPGKTVSSFPVYIPCASIVVLFGSGLAVDIVGPLAGIAAPLRAIPLLAGLEVTCLALIASSVNASPDVTIDWSPLLRPAKLGWPLVLPLIAAAGALRLNSGHGKSIALLAVIILIVLLVSISVFSHIFEESLLRTVLYAASLGVSWSYSLRGDGVYGFDISTEYQRMQQTILAGVWHAQHPNDAYGAMLSVTVMPAEIHELSGVPGLLVLKVIFPMLYAFFPVAIFDLGRKILSPRWAFIAAVFTVGQYAFTEIVSVARQEIAFVLFVALISAMLDREMPQRSQWSLVVLLSLATDLSHYSTTYVAITIIGLTLPLQWTVSWFREIPRLTGAVATAFVATLAGAAIWYLPVTHSDSHLLQVAQTVQTQGLNILPNRVAGGSLLSSYLQGNSETTIGATQYEAEITSFYENNKLFITPFPDAKSARYSLRDSPVPVPAVKWRPGYDALSLGLLLIEQCANILAAAGALLMVLRRRASPLARQIGLLALVTTLLLTLIRFSGTLALAYGQERAQLQGLVLLAITLCWTGQGMASARRHGQAYVTTIAAAGLAVILISTTYLASVAIGGSTSANLANNGAAYEYFDRTAAELASAQWLGQIVPHGQLVYADEYGQLPLAAVTGIQSGLLLDLTPRTLNQQAWVYASRTNVLDERAFAVYDDGFVSYEFPASFLNTNYDLVYTNGTSEVYHR